MENELSMGNIAIPILVGIGVTLLLVWGAWKLMPYMYALLFPEKTPEPKQRKEGKKGNATK